MKRRAPPKPPDPEAVAARARALIASLDRLMERLDRIIDDPHLETEPA